ncbi:zinc finger CCCH domain-containing protein 18 isoform X2 [Spinacia oleracea]|uniref:Zinc finger CCCH domain-containing protein 18 isoform X2 n=1 Tax=Spinacia oleracea TaxID=3562 RepID=A0A9R0JCN9_SPIOL|nr:zinc finger CCCH domain-containing protein 18-like isoform X2 [Spinacia oleracea]
MMDLSESTKIVSSRIQEIEPEHASKIVGYLLQDDGDQDMIRLAFSPDNVIRIVISNAKHTLGLSPPKQQQQQQQLQQQLQQHLQQQQQQMVYASLNNPIQYCNPYQGFPDSRVYSTSSRPLSSCRNVQITNALEDQLQRSLKFEDDNLHLRNSVNSEFLNNDGYHDQPGFVVNGTSRRLRSLIEFPPKVCHYFSKGFCKHGDNCMFLHSSSSSSSSSLGSNNTGYGNGNGNGNGNDDHYEFRVGSLKKLEMDLIELLRSRKGNPISIASLPMLYYEKYGRNLKAEGYLTESQRHGKAGYSLTRLLARLKNTICLIDRPNGQHSVILAEDASKYLEYGSDRNENGGIVPGSRQIYLTFPAESSFSEIDVSNYFNTYGLVQDVRIPSQEKRMFGFVTFVYPETVRKILAKGNPHFVCGARVLVKPYREKSRFADRKHTDKVQSSMQYKSHLFEGEAEFHSAPRASDYSRLMRQQFMYEHKEAIELEKTRLSESQLLPEPSERLRYFANSIDELKLAQEFPALEKFDFGFGNLNNGSSSEDNLRNVTGIQEREYKLMQNYGTQESNQAHNLPDNPFATSGRR